MIAAALGQARGISSQYETGALGVFAWVLILGVFVGVFVAVLLNAARRAARREELRRQKAAGRRRGAR